MDRHIKSITFRLLLSIFILSTVYSNALATHNRAGEITFEQTGPLTIKVYITTYTKFSNTSVDRDSLEFDWGDGTVEMIARTNGQGKGVDIGNDIRLNIYEAEHTYPGRATYTMGFQDPNRVGGILNVNWPNSVDVKFFLSTTVTFGDPQFDGTNSSVRLLQAPVDVACLGQPFIHNPNAFDPDGDSLSYELVTPKSSATDDVPNYLLPDRIVPGADNTISLDPRTGEFVWLSPQAQGEYNIAIRINEWRNGRIISSVTRDMQILVTDCVNNPPEVASIEEICVTAGELVELDINVSDPDTGQMVILYASGAPFLLKDSRASLSVDSTYITPEYTSKLTWQTNCNHISDNYYQIVLKGVDNYFSDSTGLADLHTIRIKVVGPEPTGLDEQINRGGIDLFWDTPYACQETEKNFFQGFSVWRKKGSNLVELDSCSTGLAGRGYERIEFNTKAVQDGRYYYRDENVEKGIVYCYRIQAEFAQISATGIPYNRIASRASDEICVQLSRDLPFLTKVSVDATDASDGSIEINWLEPSADVLDTMQFPSPFTYELFHSADGGSSYVEVPSFRYTSTTLSNETKGFTHTGISTEDNQHRYYIAFYTDNGFYDNSAEASSVYLDTEAEDKSMTLTWNEDVPWSNSLYYIYRYDNNVAMLIDSTSSRRYTDTGLDNGQEYCYLVESKGSYTLRSLPGDIRNFSQRSCGIARDNTPPCTVDLKVGTVCEDIDSYTEGIYNNTLSFDLISSCPDVDDVAGYMIYFAQTDSADLQLIETIDDPFANSFEHVIQDNISGCYRIRTYDKQGNQSEWSNKVCVDNCPLYILPNTFTPNDDGSNDVYGPLNNRFIESIDFQVYNEWGNKVWSTTDPLIQWNGKDFGDNDLAEGVYYYTCTVIERRVSGLTTSDMVLRGHINIIR